MSEENYEEMITLDFDVDLLNDNQLELEEKYVYLYDKYITLLKKYKDLCNEYSENTIIQSMKDMKERYQQLEMETVPLYRYEDLEKRNNKQKRVINAVLTILENTSKRMRLLDNSVLFDKQKDLNRCEIELVIIKELLEEYF